MKKNMISAVLVSIALVVVGFAQSVHFVKGPTFTDTGTQLSVSGKLAGLGEGDVTIVVNAEGLASVECANPGGNVAPGQDTEVDAAGSVTLPSPKNGNLVFTVATLTPSIPSSACPNNQWSAEATDVAFGSGTITVLQGGAVVLTQAF